MKKIISIILSASLIFSLSSCLAKNESDGTKKEATKTRITIDMLRETTPEHMTETLLENFVIDADINIGNTQSFNIYTARSHVFDIEDVKSVFLKGQTVKTSRMEMDGTFQYAEAEDGSGGSCYKDSLSKLHNIYYDNQYMDDRDLHYYIQMPEENKSDRYAVFPLKDLDFMSAKEACNIVGDAMNQMDINVIDYDVYPIDFEYIDNWDKNRRAMDTYDDTDEIFRIIQHSKDDEMYVIIPRIGLPNGSFIAELGFGTLAEGNENTVSVSSGEVYSVVGKDGVWYFSGSGVYDVISEETVEDIISFDTALKKIVDGYKDLHLRDTKIYKAELSYIPEIVDIEEGTYRLKPYWLFHFTRVMTDEYTQYATRYFDAITGEEVTFSEGYMSFQSFLK